MQNITISLQLDTLQNISLLSKLLNKIVNNRDNNYIYIILKRYL